MIKPFQDATVFVVDDDAGVREALAWLLRSRHLHCELHGSALAFEQRMLQGQASLQDVRLTQPCCVLLDVRMPGVSGLALFDKIASAGLHEVMPVIFLTGHADIPTAVEAVKRGAFDFYEKPFSDNALVDRIEQALGASAQVQQARHRRADVQAKLMELTERERRVMDLVVAGFPNKRIADQLEISVRTVEVHRARIFDKMNVRSAVELTNLLRTSA